MIGMSFLRDTQEDSFAKKKTRPDNDQQSHGVKPATSVNTTTDIKGDDFPTPPDLSKSPPMDAILLSSKHVGADASSFDTSLAHGEPEPRFPHGRD